MGRGIFKMGVHLDPYPIVPVRSELRCKKMPIKLLEVRPPSTLEHRWLGRGRC